MGRKSMENLQKKLDKLHEKLKVRSRMLRDEIVKKDNEKKKVLMTLKRAKETRTKTTHLATKEKRLHRQLVTLKRETTAVTSRLKQEKMHFSHAMRRLKREREKETAVRRRTLGVLIRRQIEEKLKEEEEKEDVEERRLRKEKPTLVIAKGERSHFREKVEGLMLHYLGFLGTLKKEKKRLEVQMKKLSDQKRQGRNQMAILTRALRKELQKVKHELKMKRSEKLRLQTSWKALHQDTLMQKRAKGIEREASRKEQQAERRAHAERREMAATKIVMAKLVRKIRRLQQKERHELVHLKGGRSEVARKEKELKKMTARDIARAKLTRIALQRKAAAYNSEKKEY